MPLLQPPSSRKGSPVILDLPIKQSIDIKVDIKPDLKTGLETVSPASSIAKKEDAIMTWNDRLVLWTDGSVFFTKDSRIGRVAGFAVTSRRRHDHNAWDDHSWSIESDTDVNCCEFYALTEALVRAVIQCQSNPLIKNVVVYSDSRTCLELIRDFHEQSYCHQAGFGCLEDLASIMENNGILKNLGVLVELRWVPGHKGAIGNQRADQLAGQAARSADEARAERAYAAPAPSTKPTASATHWTATSSEIAASSTRFLASPPSAVFEKSTTPPSPITTPMITPATWKKPRQRTNNSEHQKAAKSANNRVKGSRVRRSRATRFTGVATQTAEFVSHLTTGASLTTEGKETVVADGAQELVNQEILDTNTSKQGTQLDGFGVPQRTGEAQPAATGESGESQAAEVVEETTKDIVNPDPLLAHDDTELEALSTTQGISLPDVVTT